MTMPSSPEPRHYSALLASYLHGAGYRSLVAASAEDLAGAMEANQAGLTYHAARSAIRNAALAFVSEQGHVVTAQTNLDDALSSIGPRWARQRDHYASLEARNPIDDAELRAYVEECTRFCASVGVRIQRGVIGRDIDALPDAIRSGATELQRLLAISTSEELPQVVQGLMDHAQRPAAW